MRLEMRGRDELKERGAGRRRRPHRLVVIVRGGLHNGDPTFATAGGRRWERLPREMFADFRALMMDDPAGQVIIGGLPDQI
jgi:hypothetical protein